MSECLSLYLYSCVCVPVSDVVWGGKTYTGMKLAAFVLITLGLLLILLPENWTQVIVKPFKKSKAGRHTPRDSSTPVSRTLRGRLTMTTYM